MVEKSFLSRTFWFVIGLLIIILLGKVNVADTSFEQSEKILVQKRLSYTKELNEPELNEFIELYPEFKADMISSGTDIDYVSEYPENADWKTKRWFVYRVWDIGRFFYVKKRAQEALLFARERQQAAKIASQFENAEDETSKKLFEMQKAKADDLGDFSENELLLVISKANELEEIFE